MYATEGKTTPAGRPADLERAVSVSWPTICLYRFYSPDTLSVGLPVNGRRPGELVA
jgi:hypothetical protein